MNTAQLIVAASIYVTGVLLSIKPIARLVTRDSTLDPEDLAGLAVFVSLAWPIFWPCAGAVEAARHHLKGVGS